MNWLLTHFFFMGYRYESTDLQCTIIDAKIVKGERNTKPKVYFWVKLLSNRLLFYTKIVNYPLNSRLSRVNRVHLHDQTLRFSEAFTMNPPIIQL